MMKKLFAITVFLVLLNCHLGAGNNLGADTYSEIIAAASAGDSERIRNQLQAGVSPDFEDTFGYTPLVAAVKYPKVLRFLLDSGANPNFSRSKKLLPISHAASLGAWPSVELLISRGADPNLQDQQLGLTALHWAADLGNERILRLLLEKGAKVNLHARVMTSDTVQPVEMKGYTALWYAKTDRIAKALIIAGADPEECDKEGYCVIHYAAQTGRGGLLRVLLGHRVNIEQH